MPDARCTRGLVCKVARVKKRTRAYRAAENIRHSLRNGLTAYGALTPENSWPLSPPSPRGNRHVSPVGHAAPPQDLTPTSFRHRVHTLLPYAPAPLVNTSCRPLTEFTRPAVPSRARCRRVHRNPVPTFGNDGQRPFQEDRMAGFITVIWVSGKAKFYPTG